MSVRMRISDLVHIRDDPVGHSFAVCVPGQAVLGPALPLVSVLTVDQQDGEVNDVKIWHYM